MGSLDLVSPDKNSDATQETQPAKGKPVEIPVPTKADVLAAFRKVAKADDASDAGD
jgi:hypothetical protein